MGGIYGFQDVQNRHFIIGGNLGYVQFVWNGSASNTVTLAKIGGNGYVLSSNPNVPSTDIFVGYAGYFNLYLTSTVDATVVLSVNYQSLNYSITSTVYVSPGSLAQLTLPFILYGESSFVSFALSITSPSTVAQTVSVAVAWAIAELY